MVAVALELEHAVDEVLEHARAGDRAVLRHVADEDRRDAVLLGDAQQPRRGLAHLRDRARRRAELGRVERLHRVDHADVGPLAARASRRPRRARSRRGSRRCSAPPRRSARSFTCADDSSPVTSSARRVAARSPRAPSAAASTCRRRARRRRARATPARARRRARGRAPARRSGSASASSASTSTRRSSGFGGRASRRAPRRRRSSTSVPNAPQPRALAEPAAGRVAALGARELDRPPSPPDQPTTRLRTPTVPTLCRFSARVAPAPAAGSPSADCAER